MQKIGINLAVSNANAIASSLVIGLPTPVGFYGYVRGLLIKATGNDFKLGRIAIGYKDFVFDGAGGHGFSMTRGVANKITNGSHANGAIYDHVNCAFTASIVVEVDVEAEDAISLVKSMNQYMPHVPCIGGIVEVNGFIKSSVALLSDKDVTTFLRSVRMLADRTSILNETASKFGKNAMDVLMDISFRGSKEDAEGGDYSDFIQDLKYIIPTVVGYRAIEAPVTGRNGARLDLNKNPLRHCYGESVTGIAEVISARDVSNELTGFWWRPESTPTSFVLRA